MLLIKSKYKIAKRLGAGVFEKTQTQKFALSEARAKKPRGGRGGSGLQPGVFTKPGAGFERSYAPATEPRRHHRQRGGAGRGGWH